MSDPIARLNTALEGRYHLESELGEGGMARVYLANDVKHGREVALKVLKPELGEALGTERFLREIDIAGHPVRALRITYVGELGWELHVPLAATGEVFDVLMEAGAAHGVRPVGYRALEALRLEKGYRAWSSDITPNDSPFESGLGWAVKLKSELPFLGRDEAGQMVEHGVVSPRYYRVSAFSEPFPSGSELRIPQIVEGQESESRLSNEE